MSFQLGGRRLVQASWACAIALLPAVGMAPLGAAPAIAQGRPDAQTLTYGIWQLESVRYANGDTTTIADPSKYTLEFSNDGRLNLRADCNLGSGRYARSDSRLVLQMGRLTRAACPPGSWADSFLRDLAGVGSYRLASNQLYLELADNRGEMVFAPFQEPPGALSGPVWNLTEAVYPDHRLTITAAGRYTLAFDDASRVAVRADCNRSVGNYARRGNELSLALGPTTAAACPPQSLSDRFLRELGQVASYSIEDGRLVVELQNNLGTLLFEAIDENE